jgi:hypothetical protein
LRRIGPGRVVLGTIGIALGGASVLALKEATLSTHHVVDKDTRAVIVLEARSKGAERGRPLSAMVETLLLQCRLEVAHTELEGEIQHRGDRFEATLRPSLDETNQRQLRGCLEDWSIDHLMIDVLSISTVRSA